jgi:2-methylfumaryl-CoA isomerase
VHDDETGSYPYGGFARDFATADAERVRVEAFTREQFADFAKTTRLARTFAFLQRVPDADFCARGGLYTHRAAGADHTNRLRRDHPPTRHPRCTST